MPAQRPRAQFEPIPPNLDLERLVESYDHFDFCLRIRWQDVQDNGFDKFEKLVRKHVIQDGKPLVVEGLDEVLDPWTFSARWLKDNVGDKVENARDLNSKDSIPLTIRHYLKNMNAVANQHFRKHSDRPPQRIYLKDIDCPDVWQSKLSEAIPPFLYYLNDSTGDYGGPGAKLAANATVPGRRLGRGIAPAGDLMSSLPPEMRAENLMCYIGHEGTYTPSHREMCATMGHNVMVEASGEIGDDGQPERPGSSIWFMTEAKDRQTVAEFWLSKLGHDIEVENHFAQINSWKLAPFKVYIVDQRPGDFILIPPLAPHQVWNRGTRTMKIAWNRTTPETLEMAINEALPKAKIVCRDEQYKNKAIIYYTLNKYSELLRDAKAQADKLPPEAGHALLYQGKVRRLQREFRQLFVLYKDIMLSEMMSPDGTGDKCEYLPFESNVTCAYCRGNIFNRFLSCPTCVGALGHSEEEPYDVCMECYAMGRSCACISGHKWVEQFKWKELTAKYDYWRKQLTELSGDVDRAIPLSLQEERRRLGKKTLAEVVREQLKRRPFKDPSKPKEDLEGEEPSDEEVIVDDEGRVKKRIKKRSKTWLKNNTRCHVCQTRHENWKMARCTRCDRWWCFGSLFRGHDDMPLDIMENADWECTHCQGVCFAGHCRRDPRQNPFQPKGTLLGHDTRKIADARSVEVLVDFSVSNLNWIREDENNAESAQMRRALDEAEKARETQVVDEDDDGVELDAPGEDIDDTDVLENPPVDELLDPELRSENDLARKLTQYNASHSKGTRERKRGQAPDGYVAADTAGTRPFTAINGHGDGEDSYLYPDPTELEDAGPISTPDVNEDGDFRPFVKKGNKGYGRKRARASDGDEILMEKPKKRRVTEQVAEVLNMRGTTDASKQYQNMKLRKALDEAKRTGKFFMVSAQMKGRKKVVKLSVDPASLRAIVSRPAVPSTRRVTFAEPASPPKARQQKDDDADLLRSDIRSVKTLTGKPGKRKKAITSDNEDNDISDVNDDDLEEHYAQPQKRSDGTRQISAYLSARHADDEDLPDALPDDYRERRPPKIGITKDTPLPPRTKLGTWASSNATPGATNGSVTNGSAGKKKGRPAKAVGRPSKHKIMPAADSSPVGEEVHPQLNTQPSPSRRPESITEQEKNRLAKLNALKDLDGDSDMIDIDVDEAINGVLKATGGLSDMAAAAYEGIKAAVAPAANMIGGASTASLATGKTSIFDRKGGPGGRKVKIMSAKKAAT